MAVRRPLVLINGVMQQLPLTDSLPGGGGGGGIPESFDTVSQNLSSAGATFGYTDGLLTSITYASGIVKTLAYGPDGLATVTLSGATPGGIDLTKTFIYTDGNLTGFSYS